MDMNMHPLPNRVHVSVGMIIDSENRILISKRPSNKVGGGFWEFPGGKIEQYESPEAALIRELKEEVNLDVLTYHKLTQYPYRYAEYDVLLEVFIVESYIGQAIGLEGQQIQWVDINTLSNYSFLEANKKLVEIFLFNHLFAEGSSLTLD